MRLFELPPGERVEILTETVGVVAEDRGIVLNRRVRTRLTATERFELCEDGVLRRLFVEATPPLAEHTDEVWMVDAPI